MTPSATPPGFEHDIRPLFRPVDIAHMARFDIQLDDYAFMSVAENAERVYSSIAEGRMPPPGENAGWSQEKLQLLRAWIDGGRAA